MKLVILGAPASGKGTQAALLAEHFKIPAVSTGVVIRREIEKGSAVGRMADERLSQGKLLPDEDMMGIVEAWLDEDIDAAQGFLFDGFPRTVSQGEAFQGVLSARGMWLDAVIFLDAKRSTIEARVLGRLQCVQCGQVFQINEFLEDGSRCPVCQVGELQRRSDDTPDMLAKRMIEYEEKTAPLIPFYRQHSRQLLKIIDADQSAGMVFQSILKVLK